MPRKQVELPGKRVKLAPQASPVSIYHDPLGDPPASTSDLEELGEALKMFQPTARSAAELVWEKQFRDGQNAVVKADTQDREANKAGFKKAVDEGVIAPGESPWFRKGSRMQKARLAGMELQKDLELAWQKSASKNEDDASEFIQSHTAEFIKARGLDANLGSEFNSVFLPMAEQAQARMASIHTAHRVAAIEHEVKVNTDKEITIALDDVLEYGVPQEAAGAEIGRILETQYKLGLDGTEANGLAAESVIRKAKEALDPSLLDVLMKVQSGSGVVGEISYVKDAVNAAREQIYRDLEHRDRVNAAANKALAEEQSKAGLISGFKKLVADHGANVNEELAALAEIDPDAASKLWGFKQAVISGDDNRVEDDLAVVQITGKVFSGDGSEKEVLEYYNGGKINKATATKLMENVERSKELRSIARDPVVKELHTSLGKRISGEGADFSLVKSELAGRAQNIFLESMGKFKRANPEADDLQILEYGEKLQEALLRRYAPESAAAADESGDFTEDSLIVMPPESIPWTRRAVLDEAQLVTLVKDHQANPNYSRLTAIAANLNVTVREFVSTQLPLARAKIK